MAKMQLKRKEVTLTMDTTDLSECQVRLVKSINHLLSVVLKTDDEAEYFESSAELLRTVASAVKQANFGTELIAGDEPIEYTQQALEFSLDLLSEQVYGNKVISYDN